MDGVLKILFVAEALVVFFSVFVVGLAEAAVVVSCSLPSLTSLLTGRSHPARMLRDMRETSRIAINRFMR